MVAAFRHEGPARTMVHRLKYGAVPVPFLGDAVAGIVPDDATALVPVPRVTLRRWRFGVDPALEVARRAAAVRGLPVVEALAPPLWVHRRAGPAGADRGRPRFRLARQVPQGAVLVDDVVTTGTTLAAAAAVSGLRRAVTITSAVRP